MTKRRVFYSFHFDNDVFRVQQVRNMGVIEGNEPTSPNSWEQLRRTSGGVEAWINENMMGKSCVVVLIGEETYKRPWVKYEIQKAWRDGKALLGVHIHSLKCPRTGLGRKGPNPFDQFNFQRSGSSISPLVYDPPAGDAYGAIQRSMAAWIERAIAQ